MSRFFTASSSEYLEIDVAPATAVPLSIGCFFNTSDAGNDQCLVSLADKDAANHYFSLQLRGNLAGDPIAASRNAGAPETRALTTTGFSIDTIHHALGVFASANDVRVYIDGGSKGTDTTSETPSGIDRLSVARRGDSSPDRYYDGYIWELAIWTAALTDEDALALAAGESPIKIKRGSLVGYWKLRGGASPEPDFIGGNNLVLSGTPPQAEHALVAWPGSRAWSVVAQGSLTEFLNAAGAVAPAGAGVWSVATAYSGVIAPTGEPIAGVQTTLAGVVAGAANLIRQPQKLLSGAQAAAGDITKDVATAYSGVTTPTGEPIAGVQTTLAGSVTPSGTLDVLKIVLLSIAGAVTASSNLIRDVATAYSGVTTPSGEPVAGVQTALAGSVTSSGVLAVLKIVLLSIAGLVAASGTLIRSVLTAYSGMATPTGEPIAGVQTTLAGAIAASSSLVNLVITAGGAARRLFKGMFKGLFKGEL